MPTSDDLRRVFPGYVSHDLSRGDHRVVRADEVLPIDASSFVRGVDIPLTYVCLGRAAWTPEMVRVMADSHRRPIVFEELVVFAERYRSETAFHRIAAIGSKLVSAGKRASQPTPPRTPVIWAGRYGQDLCFHEGYGTRMPWPADMVFLATPIY